MANVGDLTAKLTLNTAEFEKGTERAGSLSNGLKKTFAGIGKATAAAVGVASVAVVGLVKSAVDSYASYEQLVGGVDTLFKDSSKLVQGYADTAYERAGVSANKYMEQVTSFSASLLQSLGGDTEKAAKSADSAIVDMADNANKMGTPIERIQDAYQGFAKQNYTMLDNLKLGYGGTRTEMERLLADAEKITGVKYDISNLSDVYEAIHVIQTELGITGTTALEAGTTLSGSMSMVKAAWGNLMTAIVLGGEPLSNAIDNFVSSAKTMVKNFAPAVRQALQGVGKLISELAPVILAEIPKLVEDLLPSFITAVSSILTGIMDALPQLLQTLENIAPMIIGAITGLIPTVVSFLLETAPQFIQTGITLLGAFAEGLVNNVATIVPMLTGFIQSLTDNLTLAMNNNEDGFSSPALSMLSGLASQLVTVIPQILPDLVKAVADLIAVLAVAVGQNTKELANTAITLLSTLVNNLAPAIPSLMADITNAVMAIVQAIIDVITGLDVTTFANACVTLLTALADGITSAIYVVTDALPELIVQIVAWLTAPENLTGLASAAISVFGALVSNIPAILEALVVGLAEIVLGIVNYFTENKDQIREGFMSAFTTLGEQIGTMWEEQIKPAFVTLGTNIRQYFSQFEWGATFLTFCQKIKTGITEKIENIKSAFTGENGLMGKMKKWAEEFDLKSIGTSIVTKIKNGIMSAIEDAKEAIKRALLSLVPDWAWKYIDIDGGGQKADAGLTTGQVIPQRAGGGSVIGNHPYIVGEEGAELYVPNSNGYIVPNDELQDLFGGRITVNVGNVYGESYLRDYVIETMTGAIRQEMRLGA